jgi:hypothetical protein
MKHINRRIILGLTTLIALTCARPVRAQSSGEREFAGTINKTLRVRIRLSRSGNILSGSYIYERIGTSLRLSGAMTSGATSNEEFYLNEFDERGHQTGKFEGTFASKDWLEGTWSSPGAKKEMPFSAWAIDGKEVPAANPDDRVSGEYKRVNKTGSFDPDIAVLDLWLLKNGKVRVLGYSSWVGDEANEASGNINVGNDEAIVELHGGKVFFQGEGDDDCRFTITFGVNSLLVTEDNLKCGGLNVSFDGTYRKVGQATSK